jgi:hypothetical protein
MVRGMIRRLALLAALALAITACGGSGSPVSPAGQRACHDYALWMRDGGASSQGFGNYTSLLDSAESAAMKAAPPQARAAIRSGAYKVPGGLPGRLARDISFVQGDAETDVSEPAGWGNEVAAVQVDCGNL